MPGAHLMPDGAEGGGRRRTGTLGRGGRFRLFLIADGVSQRESHRHSNHIGQDVVRKLVVEIQQRAGDSGGFQAQNGRQEAARAADVAAAVGIHPNYLANVFQEQYHMSPKQYLTKLKIKKARELLLHTDHPIYIVANSVGFTDPLAFSKFFRREMGISPSDYRAQRRQNDEFL